MNQYFMNFKNYIICLVSSLSLFSVSAQNLKFKVHTPAENQGLQLTSEEIVIEKPEVFGFSNYTGESFTARWGMCQSATHYLLNVYHINNELFDLSQNFSEVNHADGIINVEEPNFPFGWRVVEGADAELDVVLEDNGTPRILLDADADYVLGGNTETPIQSLVISAGIVNAEGITKENSSIFSITLYDDQFNEIIGGNIENLYFTMSESIDLFNDAFGFIPENVYNMKISIQKSEGREVGDFVLKDIKYSCNGRDFVLMEEPINTTSCKIEGLNPEWAYHYYVVGTNGTVRSEKSEIVVVDGFLSPELSEPTDITDTQYTANWLRTPKAVKYQINNQRIEEVEEGEEFSVLSDNFDLCTEGSMDDPITVESLDAYTKQKGWSGARFLVANGMIGADYGVKTGPYYNPGYLETPILNLSPNGGRYKVHIKAYGIPGDYLSIYRVGYVVDGKLNIHATPTFPADGYIEDTWVMEDGVDQMYLSIEPKQMKRFFLEEFTISQELEEGGLVYIPENSVIVDGQDNTSYTFTNLLPGATYGYEVFAIRHSAYGQEEISEGSGMQVLDLAVADGIESVNQPTFRTDALGRLHVHCEGGETISVYSLEGKTLQQFQAESGEQKIQLPASGLYIVKVADKSWKVVVK